VVRFVSAHSTTNPKEIRIQYYAVLREERGLSSEELATEATTPRELYAVLQSRYGFSLPIERLRVAINDAFSDWDQPLREHDSVVFIPPVAGG
jgi:molybdopterin converting factor small subunit